MSFLAPVVAGVGAIGSALGGALGGGAAAGATAGATAGAASAPLATGAGLAAETAGAASAPLAAGAALAPAVPLSLGEQAGVILGAPAAAAGKVDDAILAKIPKEYQPVYKMLRTAGGGMTASELSQQSQAPPGTADTTDPLRSRQAMLNQLLQEIFDARNT